MTAPSGATVAVLYGAALLAALGGCGASAPPPASEARPPVAVQTVVAKPGEITRSVTLPAFRILPIQEATLYAKVSGYLRTLAVDKGDFVKAGQLLGEIEVPEIQADKVQYEAEADVARTTYERMAQARQKAPDLIVPQEVDELRGKWEVARAKLQRTQALLQYARVTAPFAGVITARFVDPGAFIPAATSGTPAQSAALLTLMDASRLRVQVFVPEAEVPFVAQGTPVEIKVEELVGRTFEGSVTRVAYALDESTKTMLAEIELPNLDGTLRPGMYASVRLEVERKKDAILLPASAVLNERAGAFVLAVTDGKIKKTQIRTGFADGARVEVSGGLEAGAPVVLAASQKLADGQPVVPTEAR